MRDVIGSARRSEFVSTFRDNEAFLLLCVQVFILHIGQSLIAPILPLYAQTFGISTTLVGFLLTSQALPRVFSSLPAGRLADRFGANRLLTASCGIVTISAIAGGLAPNYAVLLITRLLQGFGSGISHTAGLTYTANISSPDKRARYMSLYQGSFLLGNSVGPVIGGTTAQYFGYRAPFFVYAVFALCVGLWMLMRLPDSRLTEEQLTSDRKTQPNIFRSARDMFRRPGVLLVCLIGLLASYTRAGSRNMALSLLGNELGLTESQIGLALTVIFLLTVISLYWIGAFADRFGTKKIIVPSWSIVAVGLIILAIAPGYGIFMLGASVYGLAAGAGAPVPVAYIANVVEEKSQGIALGLYRTFNDLGMIIGPFVMGWVGDLSQISHGVLVNAGLVILMALLFYLFAPDPEGKGELKAQEGS